MLKYNNNFIAVVIFSINIKPSNAQLIKKAYLQSNKALYSIKGDRFSLNDLEPIFCKSMRINPIYSSYVFEIPHEINSLFLARVFIYLSDRSELKEIEFKLYLTVVGRGLEDIITIREGLVVKSNTTVWDFIDHVLVGIDNLTNKYAYKFEAFDILIMRTSKLEGDRALYFLEREKINNSKKAKSASDSTSGKRSYSTYTSKKGQAYNKLKPKKLINKNRILVLCIETVKVNGQILPVAYGLYGLVPKTLRVINTIKGESGDYKDLLTIEHKGTDLMVDFIRVLEGLSKPCTILSHNFGGIDGFFLIKIANNDRLSNILMDDNNTIITMTYKNAKGVDIIFKDSARILPQPLDSLREIFGEVDKREGVEYKCTIDDSLGGSNLKLVDKLNKNLVCLSGILNNASNWLLMEYKINMFESYSASSLAMKIFRTNYLKDSIPKLHPQHDTIFREAYYGGVCDIFKPCGKNLYHYDINSLYSHSMLKDMPGKFLGIEKEVFDLNEFFGFLLIKVNVPEDCMYPQVVKRDERGGIYNPVGSWEGLYFSEEVKAFKRWGYTVTIQKAYRFSRITPFSSYVNEFYNKKRILNKGGFRFIVKLLLNGLYGYFGRKLINRKIEITNAERANFLKCTYNIYNMLWIESGEKAIIQRSISPSKELCDLIGIDYFQLLTGSAEGAGRITEGGNVAIAAAISSYSRITMGDLILGLEGECYYTDTDSIITNKSLPNNLVSNEIGKLKLENIIKEAYFISPKLYAFKKEDGSDIIKSRGIPSINLTFNDFRKLYKGENVTISINRIYKDLETFTILEKTGVSIISKEQEVFKREYVYEDGEWVGTKPIKV